MKRKNLLALALLLLTQTPPAWAMWKADEDETAMLTAGCGQQPLKVKHRGFVPFLTPVAVALNPSDPVPEYWGMAQQKVSCTLSIDDDFVKRDIILPTEYPLSGQWIYEEDRDDARTLATLKLNVFMNNQHWEVYQRQAEIWHESLPQEEEAFGGCVFNGDKVFRTRSKVLHMKNPITGERYDRTITIADTDVPQHQGYEVVYVEPFSLGGEPTKPKDEYRGEYTFGGNLSKIEELQGREEKSLIYSDGLYIYLPHITQELWKQDNSQTGFFIASYKKENRINFTSGTLIQDGYLREGLYQLLSSQEGLKRRTEKWKKFDEDEEIIIEIKPPLGVSSIDEIKEI